MPMEIIKNGNLDYLKEIVKFKCDRCKCVFKANKDEYKIYANYGIDSYYTCNCSTCGYVINKDKK